MIRWLALSMAIVAATKTYAAFDHEHADLSKALSNIVIYKDDTSEVNYAALQKRPQDFIRYIKVISRISEKEYKTFTAEQQTAFLINAYNAFTLQLVKDNFPVSSIQKIPGGPWKMKFIRLLGREYNLTDLKKRLRTEFPDPRIVFALTTASVGSPRLRNEAYVPTRLNVQLEDQAKTFLRDSDRTKLDIEKKVVHVSTLLNEIMEDLTKTGTTMTKFIAPYLSDDAKVRTELEQGTYTLDFVDPDWKLNRLSQ